jgi:hypothetical protein
MAFEAGVSPGSDIGGCDDGNDEDDDEGLLDEGLLLVEGGGTGITDQVAVGPGLVGV